MDSLYGVTCQSELFAIFLDLNPEISHTKQINSEIIENFTEISHYYCYE